MDDTSGLQRLVNGSTELIPSILSNAIASGNFWQKRTSRIETFQAYFLWSIVASSKRNFQKRAAKDYHVTTHPCRMQ